MTRDMRHINFDIEVTTEMLKDAEGHEFSALRRKLKRLLNEKNDLLQKEIRDTLARPFFRY